MTDPASEPLNTSSASPSGGPAVPPPDAGSRYRHGRCRRGGRLVILAVALTGSFLAGGVLLGRLHAEGPYDAPGTGPAPAVYDQMPMHAQPAQWFGEGQAMPEGPGGPGPAGPSGWMARHFGFHHAPPPMDPAERLMHARFMFDVALTRVGATADQKIKVLAVFDEAAKTLEPLHTHAFTTKIELAQILTAPQVDRAKLESLRAARVADIDQVSKTITKAIADIGDILTADQRVKLAMLIDHPPR